MPVKATLETLDGVDDAVKALYAEKDGKFVLDVTDIRDHPEVAALRNAYDRTKADLQAAKDDRDTAKAKLADIPEDFSAEAWDKAKNGKPDDAKLVQLRTQLEKERDDWKAKAETAEATALRNALDRDLTDALTAAGVTNPSFAKAARMILADGVKIVDGKPVVETDMGPLAMTDHVKRWAASDEGKAFVSQPVGGGSKGAGAGGSKPLSEMTGAERMELAKAGKLPTG